MSVTATWLGVELRRRWRTLLVLALLVALAAGTVLAAVTGARRTASAVDRLLALTLPATAEVSPQRSSFDWDAVRALPGVAAVSTFPTYTGFGVDEVPGDTAAIYLPADDQAMRTVERPVVLAGRLADPTRPDEAVVTARFVSGSGYGVGDTVTVRLFTPEQVDNGASGVREAVAPHPDGPIQAVRIVGVVRSLWFSDRGDEPGRLFPTPALMAAHPGSMLGNGSSEVLNAIVRLTAGPAGLDAFRADLARLDAAAGAADDGTNPEDVGAIDVAGREPVADRVRDQTAFQAAFLLAFAGAALLAALALIGQSVDRYCATALDDLRVLAAMGMTRRQAVTCAAAGPLLAAALGAVVGVGVAVGASPLLPFGAAGDVEPDPGPHVDLLVLPLGAALAVLAVGGTAAVAARLRWSGGTPGTEPMRGPRPTAPRPSAVTRTVAATGLPVPLATGVRFALEPGRGPHRVPVRPALLAAVVGVLGTTAALTFAGGVADAGEHPARFGQTYQVSVGYGYGGTDVFDPEPVNAVLTADPDVVAVDDVRFAVADSGSGTAVLFTGSTEGVVVTAGRAPTGPGEVLLAPVTGRLLGAAIGDEVRFTGDAGAVPLRVVGTGLLPQTFYNGYDSGGWVARADYDRLFAGFLNHQALLRLRPGADPLEVARRLDGSADAAGAAGALFPDLVPVPDRLVQIRDVGVLPLALGGLLALLGIGTVGHGLVAAVRYRGRDVAVLRALGMTRPQTRAVLLTQAVVTAAVGLVVGVPLGLALGRTLWRVVAQVTPLQYQQPATLPTLAVVVPAVLVATVLLAGWAGQRATRLRMRRLLQAE